MGTGASSTARLDLRERIWTIRECSRCTLGRSSGRFDWRRRMYRRCLLRQRTQGERDAPSDDFEKAVSHEYGALRRGRRERGKPAEGLATTPDRRGDVQLS